MQNGELQIHELVIPIREFRVKILMNMKKIMTQIHVII